jgi:hypothetical protein
MRGIPLIRSLRDLSGDLRYCDKDSLAATLMYAAADDLEAAYGRCVWCGENEVRYVNEYGQTCCGICPIKHGLDSIRISDVPKLVAWARDIVNAHRSVGYTELDRCDIEAASELLGQKP